MSKISSHLSTVADLNVRIGTSFDAGRFDEVENLSRLLIETIEMIRVHARMADKYPAPARMTATLKSNVDGYLWDLRCEDGRSSLHSNRENAEAHAAAMGWDIVETVSYATAN